MPIPSDTSEPTLEGRKTRAMLGSSESGVSADVARCEARVERRGGRTIKRFCYDFSSSVRRTSPSPPPPPVTLDPGRVVSCENTLDELERLDDRWIASLVRESMTFVARVGGTVIWSGLLCGL
jgi:hypothetical protein